MIQSTISSHQLKRFVKHLCIVTKHCYEREDARKKLDLHLKKIEKSDNVEKEISGLNKKINLLLEKEAKVARLGIRKRTIPVEIEEKIHLLEKKVSLIQADRDNLSKENDELKEIIGTVEHLKKTTNEVEETKRRHHERVNRIKNKVDKEYRKNMLSELKDKISVLESSYKRISNDKTIHPGRLHKIEEKLKKYKKHLKELQVF